MTNLLSNAAKFSPDGGVVEIISEDIRAKVRVAMHDRGPRHSGGVPRPHLRPLHPGRLDRLAPEGRHGLGLAICKRLVEMMQGRIGFDDRPGGGTTFWFDLPRTRTERHAARTALNRICYVEDDEDIQRIVRMSLERVGKMTVAVVSDPTKAIETIIEFKPDW